MKSTTLRHNPIPRWHRCSYVGGVKIKMLSILLPLIILSLQLKSAEPAMRIFNPVTLSNMCYKEKIIPDIIPFAPVNVLKVDFGNMSCDGGNNLFAYEVKEPPTLSWPADEERFHTLIYVAPDMPNPENATQREYQCWVVVNIPGIHVDQGQVLTDYIPPPVPTYYGSQRYVFLVYIQPKGNMTFDMPYLPPVPNDVVREKFSTAKFTKNHAYGVPFAINWFRINWGSFNRS